MARGDGIHRTSARNAKLTTDKVGKEMDSVMTYNLLYNAAVIARKGIGPVICLKLACHYDDLVFIPLSPTLKLSSVLTWKEHQMFSNMVSTFIQFAKKYKKAFLIMKTRH